MGSKRAKSFPYYEPDFIGRHPPHRSKILPQNQFLTTGVYSEAEYVELGLKKRVGGTLGGRLVLWVRNEPFEFGLLPVLPCPKLAIPYLERCMAYIKEHNWMPTLSLANWYHLCAKKLCLDWELGWTLIRYYDLLFQQSHRHQPTQGYWDKKCEDLKGQKRDPENEFTVPTLEFLLFLYIQHSVRIIREIIEKSKKSGPRAAPDTSQGQSTSPSAIAPVVQAIRNLKIPSFQEPKRETKILSEIIQFELVKAHIGTFVEFLEIGNEHKDRISGESLDALNFVLCGTLAQESSDRLFTKIQDACRNSSEHLELDAEDGSVNKEEFLLWIKQHLKHYRWGPSGCRKWNFTDTREPFIGLCAPSTNPTASKENCILWNQQDPPNSWYIFSNANDQLFHLPDLPQFTNLKIHGCSKSFFYFPSVTSNVVLHKVVNCTISLGPATKVCKVTNCEGLRFVGILRQLILCDTSASTFWIHTPCPPILTGNGNKDLVFSPYNSNYPGLLGDLKTGGFGIWKYGINNWNSAFGISMTGSPLDVRKQWKEIIPASYAKFLYPFQILEPIYKNPIWRDVNQNLDLEIAAEEKANALQYWKTKEHEEGLNPEQQKLFETIMFTRFLLYLHESGEEAELIGLSSYIETLKSNKKTPVELKCKVLSTSGPPSTLHQVVELLPLSLLDEDYEEELEDCNLKCKSSKAGGEGRGTYRHSLPFL